MPEHGAANRCSIQYGLADHHRDDAAALFWDAFSGKLGKVMRPREKALTFLARVIDPDHAVSAVDPSGRLLGVAGFKTAKGAFVGGGLADLAQIYGWIGALWRGMLLALLERDVTPGQLLMDGIFVRADARGMGVGSALLDAVGAEAVRRGCASVRLDVIDTNPRARALYERKGFRPIQTTTMGPLRLIFGFSAATTLVRPVDGTG